MGFWNSLFATTFDPSEYRVWDNQPGGVIVDRFTQDGVKFVVVEFERTPGIKYTYLA